MITDLIIKECEYSETCLRFISYLMQWIMMTLINLSVIGGGLDNARTMIKKEFSQVIVIYNTLMMAFGSERKLW
jgi:hypothetical protein